MVIKKLLRPAVMNYYKIESKYCLIAGEHNRLGLSGVFGVAQSCRPRCYRSCCHLYYHHASRIQSRHSRERPHRIRAVVLGRLNVAATILSYINIEMTWNEWYGLDRHVACADNHQLLRYVVVLFLFSHSGLSHSVLLWEPSSFLSVGVHHQSSIGED